MGVFDTVLGFFGFKEKSKSSVDAYRNPLQEKLLHTVQVQMNGEEITLEIREVKNKQAEVVGASTILPYRNEKVPVVFSAPSSDNFSVGINIVLPRELMADFKNELASMQESGQVSKGAKLSYNPEIKAAILFRRSATKINGSLDLWRDVCDGNLQTLIDDFLACAPFVMRVYGE